MGVGGHSCIWAAASSAQQLRWYVQHRGVCFSNAANVELAGFLDSASPTFSSFLHSKDSVFQSASSSVRSFHLELVFVGQTSILG